MNNCSGDERFAAWYRRALAEATVEIGIGTVIDVLTEHPTPENVAAVRDFAFDTVHSQELRGHALYSLETALGMGHVGILKLLKDTYMESGELPNPWALYRMGDLWCSEHRTELVRLLESLLERRPDVPAAVQIRGILHGPAEAYDCRPPGDPSR